MRELFVILALASATPAFAQPYFAFSEGRAADRAAVAAAARNRAVDLANQLSVMQANAQTDRALRGMAASSAAAAVPTLPFNPNAPAPVIDASKLAQIPDAMLAESNARAQAAAANRK